MGEIGGNDYNHALLAGRSLEEVQSFMTPVINEIGSAINVRTLAIIFANLIFFIYKRAWKKKRYISYDFDFNAGTNQPWGCDIYGTWVPTNRVLISLFSTIREREQGRL